MSGASLAVAPAAGASAPYLAAEARVRLPDAARGLRALRDRLDEHGATPVPAGDAWHLSLPQGRAELLAAAPGALLLRAEAAEAGALIQLRGLLAWHVGQLDPGLRFATDTGVVWRGDGCDSALLPDFRVMRVERNRALTPAMRRVTLRGDDLGRFADGGLHVRLLIPPPGVAEPEWPRLGADGLPAWPRGPRAAVPRVYTIRRIDPEAGRVEIDVVAHGDEGPGTRWARRAAPGDVVGMIGPGGGGPPAGAGRFLAAGDETALPAIARALEELPGDARGTALIEVADAGEEQVLRRPPGVTLRWLHRGAAAPGTTALLRDAVRAEWDAAPADYCWVAAEAATAEALRHFLRTERGVARNRFMAAAFWRRAGAGAH